MLAGDSILKRFLVVSLTALYLLIAVTYLLYLPKYSPLRATGNYVHLKSQVVLNPSHQVRHNAADVLVLIHRAYRSAIENKREIFSALSQIGLVLVSVITSGVALLYLMRLIVWPQKLFRPQQHVYLNYCTLRI
jgi:hypothetical protein